jgi:hypothetical protein
VCTWIANDGGKISPGFFIGCSFAFAFPRECQREPQRCAGVRKGNVCRQGSSASIPLGFVTVPVQGCVESLIGLGVAGCGSNLVGPVLIFARADGAIRQRAELSMKTASYALDHQPPASDVVVAEPLGYKLEH